MCRVLRLVQAAAEIEADMLAGHFDSSLEAYRPKVAQNPDSLRSEAILVLGVRELWQGFTEWSRTQGATERYLNWRFPPIAANLKRWGKEIDSKDAACQFVEYSHFQQVCDIRFYL